MYTTIGGKGRCRTRGESEESVVCRRGSTQARESTLALKPRGRCHQKSKTGVSVAPQKGLVSYKIFKKKKKKNLFRQDYSYYDHYPLLLLYFLRFHTHVVSLFHSFIYVCMTKTVRIHRLSSHRVLGGNIGLSIN